MAATAERVRPPDDVQVLVQLEHVHEHPHAHAGAANGPANGPNYVTGRVDYDVASALIIYEEYHPFGTSAYRAVDSTIEVSAKRYRYAAAERDEETGLDSMGLRYYAPWLGRWTSADPIGLGDGVNRYAYVHGNPVGLVDPGGTLAGHPEELPEFHSEGVSDEEFERKGREQGEASAPQGIPIGTAQDKAVSSLRLLREELGLSIETLEQTLSTFDVEEAASNETTSFFGAWVTVKLQRDVLNSVFDIPRGLLGEERLADRRLLPVSAVGSLVHEATHAFLLSDPAAEGVLSSAEEYYEGAPLMGGGSVEDAKLAVQEAAATYVAAQVTTLLEAHNELTIAEQGLAFGDEYGLEIAPKKTQSAQQLLRPAPVWWTPPFRREWGSKWPRRKDNDDSSRPSTRPRWSHSSGRAGGTSARSHANSTSPTRWCEAG